MLTLQEIYGDWPVEFAELQDRLDESLGPRNPEMRYDVLSDG